MYTLRIQIGCASGSVFNDTELESPTIMLTIGHKVRYRPHVLSILPYATILKWTVGKHTSSPSNPDRCQSRLTARSLRGRDSIVRSASQVR
jgi:hypothetical protein